MGCEGETEGGKDRKRNKDDDGTPREAEMTKVLETKVCSSY